LSKARGLLHAADVPGEKVQKKKLAERENETPLSKNGVEKNIAQCKQYKL